MGVLQTVTVMQIFGVVCERWYGSVIVSYHFIKLVIQSIFSYIYEQAKPATRLMIQSNLFTGALADKVLL